MQQPAISALIEEKGLTHQDVAGLIHKSRPYVSNTLALTRRLDEQAMARRFGDPDWVARSGREVRAARLQLEFADAALTAAVRAVDKLEA